MAPLKDPAIEAAGPDRCANPDCRVREDGRCIEGFGNKTECPHFGRFQIVPAQAAAKPEPEPTPSVTMSLSTTMSVGEADVALKSKECRVIAIAGPQDAGKTSLIAGLYDLFQLGQVGSIAFGQSYSLHAFEEAAHDSRAASRRESPDTARTARGEVRFYHLNLVDTESGAAPTVLLGDRAGEEYLEARSNPDSAKSFPELSRADVITMLVDGQRLLDVGRRHNVRSEIRQTIQAFVEAGAVSPSQRLAIVLTKVDMVRKSEEAGSRALADFEGLVANLRTSYGSKFAAVERFIIAAQPKSDGAKRGDGLDGLLAYWMAEPVRYRPAKVAFHVPPADRYFARLHRRQTGSAR
jgi:hypothetical protein